MKNSTIVWAAIAALTLSSCAQEAANKTGELNRSAFEAWVSLNKESNWTETELGSWIISLTPGDIKNKPLASVEDNPYLRLEYTVTSLDGTVEETTSEVVSKRIGKYDKRNYYGPMFSYRAYNNTYAGIEEFLAQMGVGGKCRAVVPGWLLTTSRYDTKQEYIDAMSTSTAAKIYDFTVVESVKSTEDWEMGLLKKTMGKEWDKADSLTTGVYYVRDKASDKPDTTFSASAEVYINYICRRIDGTGIDTNVADSAKVFGCSATGKPVLINWGEKATDLTMTSKKNSVIAGFAYGIYHMKPHEKGRVYMTSSAGYSSKGSGSAIPAYSPIYFEIELVDKE